MSALSDFLEQQLLNHLFRGTTYPKPDNLAIALLGSPALDSDSGNFGTANVGQLSGGRELAKTGAYNRYTVGPPGTVHFTAPGAGGAIDNTSGYTWPQATADWGWISGVAIVDNVNYGTGNILFAGSLSTPKFIASGDTFRFQTGDFDLALS